MPGLDHLTSGFSWCFLVLIIRFIYRAFASLFLIIFIFKGSEGDSFTKDCTQYVCKVYGGQGFWIETPDT